MRKFTGTLGAFAALVLAAPLSAFAQVPGTVVLDPPGSDRAGKRLAADAPRPSRPRRRGRGTPRMPRSPPPARASPPTPPTPSRPAQNVAAAPAVVPPPVIGSHQIDRYDAIEKEQQAVADNPKSLADWIILGELSHEVAMDAPADHAGKYFKMSSDAFESALALAPNNAGPEGGRPVRPRPAEERRRLREVARPLHRHVPERPPPRPGGDRQHALRQDVRASPAEPDAPRPGHPGHPAATRAPPPPRPPPLR